uniref:O-methyltransferase n=1 Tax=Camptotheca acuminata TaxID=16922 RepID=A0A2S1PVC9_CAMAC|nr:O-methyltransferase [Camptotheca acuminata]
MEGKEAVDEGAMIQGQADILQYMFHFADSMALKCAVELRIADIIHSHGCPITLSQIASGIDSPSPDISCLARVMRLLVRKKIFVASPQSDGGDTLYGLTHSSRWLLQDAEMSLAPMLLMENHPWFLAPWHCLSRCVKEGGIAFEKAHGRQIWDFASINPEFNKIFNDAMECTAKFTMRAIISGYKEGFGCVGSLVDVGGGTGGVMAEIVNANPHIKGINFDLPHVVVTAPEYPGVCHIGGDMFKDIPKADAVFMKWIMHDWGDEDCVKILKNCRKAIPEKSGKVIIVELVLQPDGEGMFDNTGLVFDLVMIAHSSGGKERTELQWKKVLEEGGFPRYKILKIPALQSIIEAYPE